MADVTLIFLDANIYDAQVAIFAATLCCRVGPNYLGGPHGPVPPVGNFFGPVTDYF